jgi:pantothenate kinase-related protein Tda10
MLNIKAEDAANRVHAVTVRFDAHKQTLDKTIALYERTKRYGKPFGLTVTGETGSGKTTVIEELKAAYPPIRMEETTVHPMVFINVPANPDIKFIYRGIISSQTS